jgi:hypothetical protein
MTSVLETDGYKFSMAKYEVTQAQWRRLSGDSPSRWTHPPQEDPALAELHPVENVDWKDARQVLLEHRSPDRPVVLGLTLTSVLLVAVCDLAIWIEELKMRRVPGTEKANIDASSV